MLLYSLWNERNLQGPLKKVNYAETANQKKRDWVQKQHEFIVFVYQIKA